MRYCAQGAAVKVWTRSGSTESRLNARTITKSGKEAMLWKAYNV